MSASDVQRLNQRPLARLTNRIVLTQQNQVLDTVEFCLAHSFRLLKATLREPFWTERDKKVS